MQEISNAGFLVEYWYLPFVISQPESIESFNNECVRVISSYKDLNRQLKKEDRDKTLYVSIQTYTGIVLRLFWTMTKHKCRLSVFGRNMIPIKPSNYTKKFKEYSISQLSNGLFNRLAYYLKQWGFIKSYDILFLSAETGINAYGYVSDKERCKSKRFLVNGNDYDVALCLKDEERKSKEDFIVFIDECLPLHPDIQICNIKPMDPDIYYNELNDFFDKIESEYELKIIIAAHPKALIYKEKDFFRGREVVFGQTAELIRDAIIVLCHDSTSIGYAVYFLKPIISLVSSSLEIGQKESFDSIKKFSEELNSRLVYIDEYCRNNDMGLLNDVFVDEKAYQRYKYRYLTNPETEHIPSVKLVIESLRSL